ncbi:MAG: hypothetical protein NWE78_00510 [Candidatus Bathyarchaeota archaeon]|nr:hypothetical protein [Candidatus Bathyarchaeota archaeon]
MEEGKKRKNKLIRIAIVLIIATILIAAAIQVYMGNILTASLIRSLETFELDSVSYPSVQPDEVELNVTFTLENSGTFRIVVERIDISFFVENNDIGGIRVDATQEILPNNTVVYFAIHFVTDEKILNILRTNSYNLKMSGTITGYSNFLFIQSRQRKLVNAFENVNGLS